MTGNENKSALVLSGGGITGAMYEIGCITAFDDFFKGWFSTQDFDIFVGTSAGSIVAALLANGISPREIFDAIVLNKKMPLNFQLQDIYCACTREIWRFFAQSLKAFPSLMKFYIQHRKQMPAGHLLQLLGEKMPVGLFKLEPLEATLKRIFLNYGGSDEFHQLNKELFITATDIDSGERVIFGESGHADVPISKAVAASSAIPALFEPVNIEGQDYVDGSVGKVAHLDVAIRHGAVRILVLNPITHVINDGQKVCFQTHDGRCGRMRDMGITFIADQANRIERRVRIQTALKRFKSEYPQVKIYLIEPDLDEGFMFSHGYMSYASRVQTLNYGYQSAMKKLPTVLQFVEFGQSRWDIYN